MRAAGLSYELVLVDDASSDRSWVAIKELANQNPRVRGLGHRRNFGQDNAIMTGLRHATGAAVVEAWSNYDDYYGHFRRYTRETLNAALAEAGIAPERTRNFSSAHSMLWRLINALGRKRAAPVPGLSLICVARRQ